MQLPLYQPIGGRCGDGNNGFNAAVQPVYFTPGAQALFNVSVQVIAANSAQLSIFPINFLPQVRAGFGFSPATIALAHQEQTGIGAAATVMFNLGPVAASTAVIVFLLLDSANHNLPWSGFVAGTEYISEPITSVPVPGAY